MREVPWTLQDRSAVNNLGVVQPGKLANFA